MTYTFDKDRFYVVTTTVSHGLLTVGNELATIHPVEFFDEEWMLAERVDELTGQENYYWDNKDV